MSPNAKGAFFALTAFGIFATHDVVVKYLGGGYSPFQVIFFSSLMSFPLVSFMLMRDPMPGTLRPVHPWWTAIRTTAAVLNGKTHRRSAGRRGRNPGFHVRDG